MARTGHRHTAMAVTLALLATVTAPQVHGRLEIEAGRDVATAAPTRTGPAPEARPITRINARDVAAQANTPLPTHVRRGLPALVATLEAPSAEPVPRISTAAVASDPVEATGSGAPPPGQITGFDGLDDADNAAVYCSGSTPCIEPPDPWVAAGRDHVIQAVNSLFRISTRTGAVALDVDPFTFFAVPAGTDGLADPRIIYDAVHERWIAIQISWDCRPDESVGTLDLAWSDTPDPLGDWWVSGFSYGGFLPDYPGIGTSTDKVVYSANVFELPPESAPGDCTDLITTYAGADVLVTDWSALLGDAPTLDYGAFLFDASLFTWRPAVATPATAAPVHLIVGLATADPDVLDVGYTRMTGTVAAGTAALGPMRNLTTLGVASPLRAPPDPQDPGGPMGNPSRPVIDGRPTDAIWQTGRLTFVSTHPCMPSGDAVLRACARVGQLDTATATPTLAQDTLIAGAGRDTFLPGAGTSGNGTLHVVYSQSSTTLGASSYAVYQRRVDAPGTFSAALRIGNAAGYAYGGDRWGDYVGIAPDLDDPYAVWQGDQHTAPDGTWRTTVSQVFAPGATYHPVSPVRLLDTRVGNGLNGAFVANTSRTFTVAGRGGVAADAIAVTGNLTVVSQTRAGYVSLTPLATSAPKTSTLNFPVGDVRANNVTISLSAAGALAAIYKTAAGARVHLLFDVTGYFTAGDGGATYKAAGPVRLLDTRVGNGLTGPFIANAPRTWQIAGRGGIPLAATAVSGNLTVANQTRAGYVSVTPTPTASPGTSTINFPLADTRANGLTVPLSGDGKLSAVYKSAAGTRTHLIFDVTGYYLTDGSGARYVPIEPARRLDTRTGAGLSGTFSSSTPRRLGVRGFAGVARNATAVAGNLTVVGQNGAGYVSITTTQEANPTTSILNFPLGDVRANGVTVPLNAGNGSVWLVFKSGAGRTTHLLLDVTGYFR